MPRRSNQSCTSSCNTDAANGLKYSRFLIRLTKSLPSANVGSNISDLLPSALGPFSHRSWNNATMFLDLIVLITSL